MTPSNRKILFNYLPKSALMYEAETSGESRVLVAKYWTHGLLSRGTHFNLVDDEIIAVVTKKWLEFRKYGDIFITITPCFKEVVVAHKPIFEDIDHVDIWLNAESLETATMIALDAPAIEIID